MERELTQSSFISFLYKRDAGLRSRAFQQFYAEFDDHKFTCASTLANSVKADVFHARARNYPSALEAALFNDDVPVAVYDNLIATVRASLQPLFRYYELRKRVLQLDEIHHYDTYVPIVAEIETNIPWDEAVRQGHRRPRTARRRILPHARRWTRPRPLVRSLRKQGQAQRRLQFVELRQSAVTS